MERWFRQKYRETGLYNIFTNYRGRGGKNEIDLVAVNEADREMVIGEVTRNPGRINIDILQNKAINIAMKRKGWHIRYVGLSLKDL